MIDYLYDGTFLGFLTCVYHHYYDEKASGIFEAEAYQESMLSGCVKVKTDEEKADKVYKAIHEKISPYDLRRIYKVFLTEIENKEMLLLRYIVKGFKIGKAISRFHGDETVFLVQKADARVGWELEKMSGLIRFEVLQNGVLYSKVDPENDIVELLAPHFCDRYKNEPFIIHDTGRDKALVAYKYQRQVTYFTGEELPELSLEEKDYQQLWKEYFKDIAIKERTNPRCQKNFMPVKYWKNLTEMQR